MAAPLYLPVPKQIATVLFHFIYLNNSSLFFCEIHVLVTTRDLSNYIVLIYIGSLLLL